MTQDRLAALMSYSLALVIGALVGLELYPHLARACGY